ncbi:MAG TPA: hypothetical protein VEW25_04220 [Allosphingosinicella sp.]|nr:hypothetical protein [Allosphingosinicella sp.]
MAVRDETDREIQRMISESGLIKEILTVDGAISIAERLGANQGGGTQLSWWAIYRRNGDTINWIFGGD